MLKIVFGVVAGFFAWLMTWFGGEKLLSAVSPEGFGVHQLAFQTVLVKGGQFTADTTFLLVHIGLATVASLIAGFLAALTAGESRRAPLALGMLLLVMGVLKAAMSWPYVPVWYHLLFTGLLLPMALLGGKLKSKK